MEQTADEGLVVRQELAQFSVGQRAAVGEHSELLRPLIRCCVAIAIAQVLTNVIQAVSVRAVSFVHGLRLLQVLRKGQNLQQRSFTLLDFSLVLGLVRV